jgi:hypothetical protein
MGSNPDKINEFSIDLILPVTYPGEEPVSNRYEFQESPCGGNGQPVHKDENLTAICEPNI